MLKASLLLFSRTLIRDYRWIYVDDNLTSADINLMQSDYKKFEISKKNYLSGPHLFLRRFSRGIAIYKFVESSLIDQNSRKIYALLGFSFSDLDLDIFQQLLKYVTATLFLESSYFDLNFDNITDRINGQKSVVNLDLNTIIDFCRKSMIVPRLSTDIHNFIWQNNCENILITNSGIKQLQNDTSRYAEGSIFDLIASDSSNFSSTSPTISSPSDAVHSSLNEDASKGSIFYKRFPKKRE